MYELASLSTDQDVKTRDAASQDGKQHWQSQPKEPNVSCLQDLWLQHVRRHWGSSAHTHVDHGPASRPHDRQRRPTRRAVQSLQLKRR